MTAAGEERRTGTDNDRGGDTESIRAGISEARERISHDLDEIGERLNPHSIKEDIKDGIREATIGRVEDMARQAGQRLNDAGSGIVQTIKDNPLPAAVAGFGIAWLLMSSGSSRKRPGSVNETGSVDRAREKVGDLASQAQEAVSDAARPPIESIRSTFEDNPMALAAGAAALGLAFGLLAPPTRQEARIMGDVGERVVEKAGEFARDTGKKVQDVADRVMAETKPVAEPA